MILAILTGCFEAVWRRMFGSDGWNKPIIQNRFIQHIIGFVGVSGALWISGYHWAQAVVVALALQGLYWAPGHGPAFDMSRDGLPDDEMKERYQKYFWDKWVKFLVPAGGWYGFGYDFLWMFFRYELPALLVAIALGSAYFGFAGLLVALVYAVFWSLKDCGKIKNSSTAVAEWVAGFITGFLLII